MRQHNSMMCYKLECYLCNRVLIIHTYMCSSVVSILAERCYMGSLFIFCDILYLCLQGVLKHCVNSNCNHTQSLELRHSVPLLSSIVINGLFQKIFLETTSTISKVIAMSLYPIIGGKFTRTDMVRAQTLLA